jgi:hypothetical protein
LNSSIISATPVNADIATIEIPGVDVSGSWLYNSLNAGTSKTQLASLVNQYNSAYGGTKDAQGGVIPRLVLPSNYAFGAPIFSQDFKLSKIFTYKERYKLELRGEIFNAFNISNPGGYSFTLDTQAAAGSPQTFASRVGQSLGQGGPR